MPLIKCFTRCLLVFVFLFLATIKVLAADVIIDTAPFIRDNTTSPPTIMVGSDAEPIQENFKNISVIGSPAYLAYKVDTGIASAFENANHEELIYLAVHHSSTAGGGLPNVDVVLDSAHGSATGLVSLVLVAADMPGWNITVDGSVDLSTIYIFNGHSGTDVVVTLNGTSHTFGHGDEFSIGDVNVRVSSVAICGYYTPQDDQGCDTDLVLGTNHISDDIFYTETNSTDANFLLDLTTLKITSFNGSYLAKSFTISVESAPYGTTSPILVTQLDPSTYTLDWFPVSTNDDYVLLEGTTHFNSFGGYEAVSWQPIQRGGTTYSITDQALGQYKYRLVAATAVAMPLGSIVEYQDVAESSDIYVDAPPIFRAYNSTDTPSSIAEATTYTSYSRDYHLAVPFSGLDGRRIAMERKDIAGFWVPQTPTRFNIIERQFEWDYNNQQEEGVVGYRARLSYEECLTNPIVADALDAIFGFSELCRDASLVTQKSLSVVINEQQLQEFDIGLRWESVSGSPHAILEELTENEEWVVVSEGVNTQWFGATTSSNYRVKTCQIENEDVGVCSLYTYFSGSKSAPLPAEKPQIMGHGDDTIGTTEGVFRVNEGGAATYNIPVVVGVGTAGVQPDVSLVYSSQGPNGIAGKGWALNAISAITRCRQTLQIDGVASPITWTEDDRYCLDGQRLILASGSEYGSIGATYKTEIDTFAIVTSVGGGLGHPDHFTIERKDGSISQYGGDSSYSLSRLQNSDGQTLTWAINRFADSVGNPIKYQYINESNAFSISRIDFGFGADRGQNTSNSYMEFEYDDTRLDPKGSFVAGHYFSNTLRLKSIQSYSEFNSSAALLRSYHLTYQDAPSSDTRVESDNVISQLANVQECTSYPSHCLQPTTFEWADSVVWKDAGVDKSKSIDLAGGLGVSRQVFADINGDGLQDIVWLRIKGASDSSNDQYLEYALATSSGYVIKPFSPDSPLNIDDGDDCDRSTGTWCYKYGENAYEEEPVKIEVVDYNADGRQDILVYSHNQAQWQLYLSTPQINGGWKLRRDIVMPFTAQKTYFLDVNADGLIDALSFTNTTLNAHLLSVSGEPASSSKFYDYGSMVSYSVPMPAPGFFEIGDTTTLLNGQTVTTTENGFFSTAHPITSSILLPDGVSPLVADMDADGKSEIILVIREIGHCGEGGSASLCSNDKIVPYSLGDSELSVYGNSHPTLIRNAVVPSSIYGSRNNFQYFLSSSDINSDGASDLFFGLRYDYAAGLFCGTAVKQYMVIGTGTSTQNIQAGKTNLQEYNYPYCNSASYDKRYYPMTPVDLNQDGYGDLYWRNDSTLYVRYWQPDENGLGETEVLRSGLSSSSEFSYSLQNIDGVAGLELISINYRAGDLSTTHYNVLPDGHDNIENIVNGLGMITSIEYSSILNTENYKRVEGIGDGVPMTRTHCQVVPRGKFYGTSCQDIEYTSANSDAFYSRLNAPLSDLPAGSDAIFAGSTLPILEYYSPLSVVTRIESSSPTADLTVQDSVDYNAKISVEYTYYEAKIQAGGRGYLGFNKIESFDQQTGIKKATSYRQDFPFIGSPYETNTWTASGELLSRSTNNWQLRSSARGEFIPNASNPLAHTWLIDIAANGTGVLGAIYGYLGESIDTTFSSQTDAVNVGLLIVSDSVQQTLVASNSYDNHGNLLANVIETYSGDQSTGTLVKSQSTVNEYSPTGNWTAADALRYGRLGRAIVTQNRSEVDLPEHVAVSAFSYYPLHESGQLKSETFEPDRPEFTVATTYVYDVHGNQIGATKTTPNSLGLEVGANTRASRTDYDVLGRFVDRIYDDNDNLIQSVLTRNRYGAVKKAIDFDGVVSETEFSPFGTPYLNYSSTGIWNHTFKINCVITPSECPGGAVYGVKSTSATGAQSTVFFDVLKRKIEVRQTGFDGGIIKTQVEYDSQGRQMRASTPFYNEGNRHWSETIYDVLGRSLEQVLPHDGIPVKRTFSYDGLTTTTTQTAPNLSGMITGNTQQSSQYSNVLGEVINVIDSLNGEVSFEYDHRGNLRTTLTRSHSDGGGVAAGDVPLSISVDLIYDHAGRKTEMIDPDKGHWLYGYNGFGELIWQTDGNGNLSEFTYDSLGRTKLRYDYLDSDADPSTSTDRDLEGHTVWTFNDLYLTQVTDNQTGFIQQFVYDALGRESEVTTTTGSNADDITFTTSVTYDQLGRVFQKFDGSGANQGVEYKYNEYGYLQEVSESKMNDGEYQRYFTVMQMTARGQVSEIEWSNGYRTLKHYNFATGLPETIQTFDAFEALQDVEVTFDDFGNLVERINSGLGLTANTMTPIAKPGLVEGFKYDGLNRLREVSIDASVTQEIMYDSFGNIKFKTGVGTYSYGQTVNGSNAGPHAVTLTSLDGAVYEYDNNGNLVFDTTDDGNGRALEYSSFDKPTLIAKGNHVIEFDYDVNRSRFKRVDSDFSTGDVDKTTIYMGSVERIHHSDGRLELKRYIEGLVLVTDTLVGDALTSLTQYVIKDHLGTTELILNAEPVLQGINNVRVAADLSFDAWGQRRASQDWSSLSLLDQLTFDTSITTKGFTGHEMLDEVGLIHMNGRIYDARLGRFMQADPFIQQANDAQMYNRYSYVRNNPLTYDDPSGYIVPALVGLLAVAGGYSATTVALSVAFTAFAQTLIMGGNFGDAIAAGIIGGATSAAFSAIGGFDFAGSELAGLIGDTATKALAFGSVGGLSSLFSGGKFGHGFVSAGLGAAVGGSRIFGESAAGKALLSATIGGTASKLTGGKFANGAATAAFTSLVSSAAHAAADPNKAHLNKARKYLNKSKAFKGAYAKAKKYGVKINVDIEGRSWFDHETNTVHWNPVEGNMIEAGISSPATILAHEISHAVEFNEVGLASFEAALDSPILSSDMTLSFDGMVEVKVSYGVSQEEARATNFERLVQSQLGEPQRADYRDAGNVLVDSPTFSCFKGSAGCQ